MTLHTLATGEQLDGLAALLRGRAVAVLSGAGCSTDSGIPDYRGPDGTLRARAPLQYGEFVREDATRVRYWSRSAVGWPRFRAARPNAAHSVLARLEAAGVVRGIITQNVDGLHQAAGSRRVIELHGSLAWVRCLECGDRVGRRALQTELETRNREWLERMQAAPRRTESRPDGDAELSDVPHDFRVPDCVCGGVLKPDVVLFGESVPRERVDAAWRLVDEADVLLVVGSSLAVYSGRRFVYGAHKRSLPVAIINRGPTRGDELAAVKVDAELGAVLPALCGMLTG